MNFGIYKITEKIPYVNFFISKDLKIKNSTRISVVIPTYRGEKFLNETLDSIINQSRPPDELIISDDHSDDETKNIILNFRKDASFPIFWIDHKPSGVTDNYLHAVGHASGDIIIIADQDDVWINDKVLIIEKFFSDNPSIVLASSDSLIVDQYNSSLGRTLRIDSNRSIILSSKINDGDDFNEYLKGGLPLLAHTLSFRSIIKPRLLDKPEYIPEWWFEEWVCCVAVCMGQLGFIPDALTRYRQHPWNTAGEPRNGILQKLNKIQPIYPRLRKMEYCRSIILSSKTLSPNEKNHRIGIINKYINFLSIRKNIREKKNVRSFIFAFKAFFSGDYREYSRGCLSFLRDLIYSPGR